jgi:hypothetical protein
MLQRKTASMTQADVMRIQKNRLPSHDLTFAQRLVRCIEVSAAEQREARCCRKTALRIIQSDDTDVIVIRAA